MCHTKTVNIFIVKCNFLFTKMNFLKVTIVTIFNLLSTQLIFMVTFFSLITYILMPSSIFTNPLRPLPSTITTLLSMSMSCFFVYFFHSHLPPHQNCQLAIYQSATYFNNRFFFVIFRLFKSSSNTTFGEG